MNVTDYLHINIFLIQRKTEKHNFENIVPNIVSFRRFL